MPTVSIHYGPDHALDAAAFAALAEDMAELIEQWLGPERQKIQIMPIALAHPPLGRVACVEIKARDSDARTDAVVQQFIAALDSLTQEVFGGPCRIRYTRVPGDLLVAAN